MPLIDNIRLEGRDVTLTLTKRGTAQLIQSRDIASAVAEMIDGDYAIYHLAGHENSVTIMLEAIGEYKLVGKHGGDCGRVVVKQETRVIMLKPSRFNQDAAMAEMIASHETMLQRIGINL